MEISTIIAFTLSFIGILGTSIEKLRSISHEYEPKLNKLREAKGTELNEEFTRFLEKVQNEKQKDETMLFDHIYLNHLSELTELYNKLDAWYSYKYAVPIVKEKRVRYYKFSISAWFVNALLFLILNYTDIQEKWNSSLLYAYLVVTINYIFWISALIPIIIIVSIVFYSLNLEKEWDAEIFQTQHAPSKVIKNK